MKINWLKHNKRFFRSKEIFYKLFSWDLKDKGKNGAYEQIREQDYIRPGKNYGFHLDN